MSGIGEMIGTGTGIETETETGKGDLGTGTGKEGTATEMTTGKKAGEIETALGRKRRKGETTRLWKIEDVMEWWYSAMGRDDSTISKREALLQEDEEGEQGEARTGNNEGIEGK